jgi:hypothetical protein
MLGDPEALSHSVSGTLILSLRKLLKGLSSPPTAEIQALGQGLPLSPRKSAMSQYNLGPQSIRVAAALARAWPPWALSPKSNHGEYMLASRGL